MKILTLWQPYASLIAVGAKRIETRSCGTDYRGPIAIHSANKWDSEILTYIENDKMTEILNKYNLMDAWDYSLPLGQILCVANLFRIESTNIIVPDPFLEPGSIEGCLDDMLSISFQEYELGNYSKNRKAWFLDNIVPLKEPMPYKGSQMLKDYTGPKLELKDGYYVY